MSPETPEFFPLAGGWPHYETAMTVFRYALLRDLCRGKRVLEVGAAAGEGTLLLADAAAETVAVDHQDLWAISPAADRPNVRFVRADACALPKELGRFDVVVALELLEHLSDPAAFLRSAREALAEGGVLVLSTPNFDLYSDRGDGSRKPVFVHHVREYRRQELTVLLAGWEGAEILGLSQLSLPQGPDPAGEYALRLCCREVVYDLFLGGRYPQYRLCRWGALPAALRLEHCQSFLAILGRQAGAAAASLLPAGPAAPAGSMTLEEATFQSCHVVLQRRNEHVLALMDISVALEETVKLLRPHAAALEGIVKDREARLASLTRQVRSLRRRHPLRLLRLIWRHRRGGRAGR